MTSTKIKAYYTPTYQSLSIKTPYLHDAIMESYNLMNDVNNILLKLTPLSNTT